MDQSAVKEMKAKMVRLMNGESVAEVREAGDLLAKTLGEKLAGLGTTAQWDDVVAMFERALEITRENADNGGERLEWVKRDYFAALYGVLLGKTACVRGGRK